jgi:F0F1-type ATP synthase assembly protein I
MPSESEHENREEPLSPAAKKARNAASATTLALELPFTLFGAVALGAGAGYLLDRSFHTLPWLSVALGALGFYGGLREVLRRLDSMDDSKPTSK